MVGDPFQNYDRGYTRVCLPPIPVYIRYVWVLSLYIRPFRSRIHAFLIVAIYLPKLRRRNMRNKCPNIRALEGHIYTRDNYRKLCMKSAF